MPAPEQNISPFETGERLTAARLDQLRATLASLVDAYEARFGPIDGADSTAETHGVFKSNTPTDSRDGVSTGSLCRGNIIATSTGAITESNLGEKSSSGDDSDPKDVEVWDVSILGHRIGHFAGISSSGTPLMLVAGGVAGLVTITGNATGGGVYTGYVRRPVKQKFDPTRSGTLDSDTVNQFGEIPSDTSEIYILNGAERSTDTHALTEAGTNKSVDYPAYLLSMPATDGKPVWVINGSTMEVCAVPA
jgi:hypothetical protein